MDRTENLTLQTSQSGAAASASASETLPEAGWTSGMRRCLWTSLLARWTRRSQAEQSAASSAQQSTAAGAAPQKSQRTCMAKPMGEETLRRRENLVGAKLALKLQRQRLKKERRLEMRETERTWRDGCSEDNKTEQEGVVRLNYPP